MKQLSITAYILLASILFVSCEKRDADPDYEHWMVVEVDGVQQANVGQSVSLLVSWPYSSGCDIVDRFETKKLGNLYQVKAMGYYQNSICTQDAGIKTIVYQFTPPAPGLYDIDFENPDGSVIRHSILVQ